MSQSAIESAPVPNRRNVAYVIGGGLTCATAKCSGFQPNQFALPTICSEIMEKLGGNDVLRDDESTGPLINWLLTDATDRTPNLEELVEHLETSGRRACEQMAEAIAYEFADLLSTRVKELTADLSVNLASVLLDYHRVDDNPENLLGFVTTNYDPLLERAFEEHEYTPDYGFSSAGDSCDGLPLLKLHGSIDWAETVPVQISNTPGEGRPLWIGPRRTKTGQQYPFNMIWGRAREILAEAEVIRIIGASLQAADWHLTQLIFQTAMIDSTTPQAKTIELINSVDTSDRIRNTYPLLPCTAIYEIEYVVRFYQSSLGVQLWDKRVKSDHVQATREYLRRISNVAEYWLQAQASKLINTLGSIETSTGQLERFMEDQ